MPFNISVRIPDTNPDVRILDLSGRFAEGASVKYREVVRDQLAEGNQKLLINFSDVTSIGSAGLGALWAGLTLTKNQGGEYKLFNPTNGTNAILHQVNFYDEIEIYGVETKVVHESEPDAFGRAKATAQAEATAVASFSNGPAAAAKKLVHALSQPLAANGGPIG